MIITIILSILCTIAFIAISLANNLLVFLICWGLCIITTSITDRLNLWGKVPSDPDWHK